MPLNNKWLELYSNATAAQRSGEIDKAENYFKYAIEKAPEYDVDEKSYEFIDSLKQLINCVRTEERIGEAVAPATKLYKVSISRYGLDAEQTFESQMILAGSCVACDRDLEALPILGHALSTSVKKYGQKSSKTDSVLTLLELAIDAVGNITGPEQSVNQRQEAEKLLQKIRGTLPDEHKFVKKLSSIVNKISPATTLPNENANKESISSANILEIARQARNKQQYQSALNLLEKALHRFDSGIEPIEPMTFVNVLTDMGGCYVQLSQLAQAEIYYRRLYDTLVNMGSAVMVMTTTAQFLLAGVLYKQALIALYETGHETELRQVSIERLLEAEKLAHSSFLYSLNSEQIEVRYRIDRKLLLAEIFFLRGREEECVEMLGAALLCKVWIDGSSNPETVAFAEKYIQYHQIYEIKRLSDPEKICCWRQRCDMVMVEALGEIKAKQVKDWAIEKVRREIAQGNNFTLEEEAGSAIRLVIAKAKDIEPKQEIQITREQLVDLCDDAKRRMEQKDYKRALSYLYYALDKAEEAGMTKDEAVYCRIVNDIRECIRIESQSD